MVSIEESITDFSNNLRENSISGANKSVGRDFSFAVNHPLVKLHGGMFRKEGGGSDGKGGISRVGRHGVGIGRIGYPKIAHEIESESENESENRSEAVTDKEMEEETKEKVKKETKEEIKEKTEEMVKAVYLHDDIIPKPRKKWKTSSHLTLEFVRFELPAPIVYWKMIGP
ncbi:hypothetical protein ACH5RR_028819 [Cinchona calisaya]|uniref:Uncharacterized protein n=1 Tax=Cinchona calisaya TaxID=153742 RepID=A0ABD2YV54_9GENT